MKKFLFLVLPLVGSFIVAGAVGVRAEQAVPEVVIVKYGKLIVKSPTPDAKIFVDDVYKGPAGTVIDDIAVGEHAISCRTESRKVSGKFRIKKDETTVLEAFFDEGKLRPVVEKVVVPEKTEPAKKTEVKAPKLKKTKKAVVEARKTESKKIEKRKNPVEERRKLHLCVFRVFFEDVDAGEARISHKANPKVVSSYREKKNRTGSYYRTKKDVLLCDIGPCEQQWAASFVYTDDTGRSDTFGLTWKNTVFNGITPSGTNKQELLFCLNGACRTLESTAAADTAQVVETARYHITWSKSALAVRRSDIMKEVVDAGGAVEAYDR